MSGRGWFVLDGRRVMAGPLDHEPTPYEVDVVKAWLHRDLRDLAKVAVVTHEEIQRRLRGVRVAFGVRASRGGFKRLPLPSSIQSSSP